MSSKPLDYENLNENVKKCQYAVRGELYLRASQLQKEGNKIVFTNVGNPHALGQKPLTFPRQVIALCQAPFLLDDPNVGLLFPADAIERAKHYLSLNSGGLGAYSDSRGIPGVRKEIADFIERRDGYPSDPELIFLTDGASKGIMQILHTIIRGANDGVLVPVPQYPLYSATISLYGGSLVPYYLEETADWGLDINELRQSIGQARQNGTTVLLDMGQPISKELQLVSFHTVSKGYWGECGQRGGYFEMNNIPPKSVEEIYKVSSISLSPNVPAQIFLGLLANPPKPGDISYEQFVRERDIYTGAMYSFPQIKLPPGAIDAAKKLGKAPDVFYCLKLLEATGISTVPGSGFGQKEGSLFEFETPWQWLCFEDMAKKWLMSAISTIATDYRRPFPVALRAGVPPKDNYLASRRRYACNNADFGWGKPIWVGSGQLATKDIIGFMDTKSGDGIEAWVNLKAEDMAKFEADNKLLAFCNNGI
ncbi:hypothetical protein RND71_007254 [Anisodus tanguticus]|uniref:Aminotransferase class I/classII large domain-containing protein n=1 Tax=Anisodus tanguticus TaxID=243964 RepID=A0AAE1SLH8_9SOLA|nr:hypothetical protein RND71_007254 [Anisodus tanguticus]